MIWILFSTLMAHANSLDHVLLRKIANAKGPHEVERIREAGDKIRITRLACRLQLERRLIPQACYEALSLEKAFGLHTDREQLALQIHELDVRCFAAARDRIPPADLRSTGLSIPCQNAIKKAVELGQYRAGDVDWREY